MAQFNQIQKSNQVIETFEGGTGYKKSLESEWANTLFSYLYNDKFYETSEEAEKRYIDLTYQMIEKYGPDFVGKASVFSRNELGMRSISALTAAILNSCQWDSKRYFYANYFHRPDDVGEVFSAVKYLGFKNSHALIRGAADYLSTLDEYKISKYQMKNHEYNMHDILNLTHAKSEVIDKYQKGILNSPDTWEVAISTASPEEKEYEWKRLVEEKKLGYLALIRNLRNIMNCSFATDSWVKEYLYDQLVNEQAIKKSLVFPYQIYTTWRVNVNYSSAILDSALDEAFKLSVGNMPELSGNSLIVLDVSGSMDDKFNRKGLLSIKEACAVYAAAFYMSNNDIDFIKFGSFAKKFDKYKKYNNSFKLTYAMQENDNCGYGTSISSVFDIIDKHYDRILLFSDMQVMDSNYYNQDSDIMLKEYEKNYGNTHIYSFDLGNYRSQICNSHKDKITYITALTDIVFKAIQLNEKDEKSLIDVIKEYRY